MGTAQSNDAPSFRDATDLEFTLDSAASPHLVAPGCFTVLVNARGGYKPACLDIKTSTFIRTP